MARIRRLRSIPIVIVQEVESPIPSQLETDAEVLITSTVTPSGHNPFVRKNIPTSYGIEDISNYNFLQANPDSRWDFGKMGNEISKSWGFGSFPLYGALV